MPRHDVQDIAFGNHDSITRQKDGQNILKFYGLNDISYYFGGGDSAVKGGCGHDLKIKNGDASCAGPETAYDTVKNCSIRCSGNLTTGHTVAIQGTSEADIATLYLATPNTTQNPY